MSKYTVLPTKTSLWRRSQRALCL